MAAEHAIALVVRGSDWSETSRIVTLYTREFGKIRGLAKGGRRLRSSFETAFDLLNVCQILFLRKAQGGLDLLTEARVEERFPALRSDLSALYAGYYVAELLADGSQDYDPHPILFDVALGTLRRLGTPPADLFVTLAAFELVWLRELGYSPRLDACVGCDQDLTASDGREPGFGFSPTLGGMVCRSCAASHRDRWPLSVLAWRSLRELTTGHSAVAVPTGVRNEIRQLLSHAVSAVLGRRPRLLKYVEAGSEAGGSATNTHRRWQPPKPG
ncbi:MAG: DNA repair protein RecO [Bacteroidales bacterium]|nr:DNA repair protein RecO [Bacteroidales bacterium]